jgi:hypothetical protein
VPNAELESLLHPPRSIPLLTFLRLEPFAFPYQQIYPRCSYKAPWSISDVRKKIAGEELLQSREARISTHYVRAVCRIHTVPWSWVCGSISILARWLSCPQFAPCVRHTSTLKIPEEQSRIQSYSECSNQHNPFCRRCPACTVGPETHAATHWP